MNDWLIGLSSHLPTDEEVLNTTFKEMSVSELDKLAFDLDPLSFQTRAEKLREKLAVAERTGRELAHEDNGLQKIAFVPALLTGAARLAPMAGRAVKSLGGAKGIVGGVAKDMAIGTVANKAIGALKPAAPAASAAGEVAGGFKYAFASGLLQRAAGYTVKNPGTALTAAGAIGGAMMAPRDPQTGQKQYLRGAVMGGVGAAGVNAVSNGRLANRLRSSVMNPQSPLLGQGTRRYLMDSAASARGKVPGAGGKYTRAAPSAPTSATSAAPTPAAAPVRSQSPEWAAAHRGAQNMRQGAGFDAMHAVGMDPHWEAPISAAAAPHPLGPAPYRSGPVMGSAKLAETRFLNMSPAEQILYVARLEKKANQQTLTYDPATKTFTRQHLTPSSGSEVVQGTGAAPIPAGHTEMVRNSGTGMAPYGSKDYLQSRIRSASVGTSPAYQTPLHGSSMALAPAPAASRGRGARWEMNEGMGTGRPVIHKKPATIPGRIGGVAGIGAAAAKPKALPTMAGLSLVRR